MTQDDLNRLAEESMPPEVDLTRTNSQGWVYSGRRPSRSQVTEGARLELECKQENVDRLKLDTQAKRSNYAWKLRQMRQRGRRS